MQGKNDETKRIPIVNKQDSAPSQTTGQSSPVRGFDPSKVMFVPSDKSAKPVHVPADVNQPDTVKSITSGTADDADVTAAVPVVEAADATAAVPVVETADTVSPKKEQTDNFAPDNDATVEIPLVTDADINGDFSAPAANASTAHEEHSQPKKADTAPRSKARKWIYAIVFSIVSVILCLTVIMTYVFPRIIEEGGTAILNNVSAIMGEPPENVNVLLVGTDKGGYRTDTIMVASYDNDTQTVHVLQIPRDTYVKGNGRSDKKINSAYYSGIDTLKDEIFKAFGIEIHRYLAVELDGFVEIIDAIGGVEVDVPINMHYDDPTQDLHIHIKKGLQVLDGKDAEGFVRYRKGNDGSSYPLGDIDRMKAQKQFLQNTVSKIVSIDGASKIPELIDIAKDNIETDISTSEATSYAAKVLSLSSESINFYTAPGVPLYKYGGWYYFIDGEENYTLVMNYFNGDNNKKSYSPVYFDLSQGADETVSSTESQYDSSDVSDDERYSYYSPDDDMGYYDDDADYDSSSAEAQSPVIDDEDEDEDGSAGQSSATQTRPGSSGAASQQQGSQSQSGISQTRPSSSQSPSSNSSSSQSGNSGSANNQQQGSSSSQSPSLSSPPSQSTTPSQSAPEIDLD